MSRLIRLACAGLLLAVSLVARTARAEDAPAQAEAASPPKTWLGALWVNLDTGPTLLYIQTGSPAEKAGLQPLDRIARVNGKQYPYPFDEVTDALYAPPGSDVQLEVNRPGAADPVLTTLRTVEPPAGLKDPVWEGDAKFFDNKYQEAIDLLKGPAKRGVMLAQTNLARAYDVLQQPDKAIPWYLKAAAQGDPEAQNFLALCYRDGRGVKKDVAEWMRWLGKSANQGYGSAQSDLAIAALDGTNGVKRDDAVALSWAGRAAAQSQPGAYLVLGRLYEEGRAVAKDIQTAAAWYEKALTASRESIKTYAQKRLELLRPGLALLEADRQGAEAESRGDWDAAVQAYAQSFQMMTSWDVASPDWQGRRDRLVAAIKHLRTPPAVPEEARRFGTRGNAAIKQIGSGTSSYADAVREFRQAVWQAPWWTEAWYNLGLAHEKAGQFDQALDAYRTVVALGARSPDPEQLRTRIYEMEFARDQANKFQGLNGRWRGTKTGDVLTVAADAKGAFRASTNGIVRFVGTRRGRDISGDVGLDGETIKPYNCYIPANDDAGSFRGAISENFQRIEISYSYYGSSFYYHKVSGLFEDTYECDDVEEGMGDKHTIEDVWVRAQ